MWHQKTFLVFTYWSQQNTQACIFSITKTPSFTQNVNEKNHKIHYMSFQDSGYFVFVIDEYNNQII